MTDDRAELIAAEAKVMEGQSELGRLKNEVQNLERDGVDAMKKKRELRRLEECRLHRRTTFFVLPSFKPATRQLHLELQDQCWYRVRGLCEMRFNPPYLTEERAR